MDKATEGWWWWEHATAQTKRWWSFAPSPESWGEGEEGTPCWVPNRELLVDCSYFSLRHSEDICRICPVTVCVLTANTLFTRLKPTSTFWTDLKFVKREPILLQSSVNIKLQLTEWRDYNTDIKDCESSNAETVTAVWTWPSVPSLRVWSSSGVMLEMYHTDLSQMWSLISTCAWPDLYPVTVVSTLGSVFECSQSWTDLELISLPLGSAITINTSAKIFTEDQLCSIVLPGQQDVSEDPCLWTRFSPVQSCPLWPASWLCDMFVRLHRFSWHFSLKSWNYRLLFYQMTLIFEWDHHLKSKKILYSIIRSICNDIQVGHGGNFTHF